MKTLMRASRPMVRASMIRSMPLVQSRAFSMKKYHFDDTDYEPTITQLSAETHRSNAEELINSMPIV